MIYAMEKNEPHHRCSGELAYHVLDIIDTVINAAKKKGEVEIQSTCRRPKPFSEKEIKLLLK